MKSKFGGVRFLANCISIILLFAILLISGGCSWDSDEIEFQALDPTSRLVLTMIPFSSILPLGVAMKESSLSQNHVLAGQHKKTPLVINRLSRIEGHVRAIKRMLKEGRSCPDVLIQLAAVKSAVRKVAQIVLEDHIESCLDEAAIKGTSVKEWHSLKQALDKYIS